MKSFVSNDGVIIGAQSFSLHQNSRTLLYGTGFFETVRWQGGALPLWHFHLQRIEKALSLMQAKMHAAINIEHIPQYIADTIAANSPSKASRCRLMFYELDKEGELHLLVQTHSLHSALHASQPHVIHVCKNLFAAQHYLSGIKCNSYSAYLHAFEQAQKFGYTEALLLNTNKQIMEASRANLFLMSKSGEIVTPPLGSGCVAGVGRAYILHRASQCIKPHIVQREIKLDDVYNADELVLVNALHGVQRVNQVIKTKFEGTQLFDTLCDVWN